MIELYQRARNITGESVTFNFSDTLWFEANLSAVFGAIIELLKNSNKTIYVSDISPQISDVLQRNQFLCDFGALPIYDRFDTIVQYNTFSPSADSAFLNYIKDELLSKRDFPRHSQKLGKKISESIFELYENARTHGRCRKIHTCGQYYPNKTPKRLDITIVDMGKTIKANVNAFLDKNMKGDEAIEWALQYGKKS